MHDNPSATDSLIEIGLVVKAHGINGFVKLKPYNQESRLFLPNARLLVQQASESQPPPKPRSLRIEAVKPATQGIIARFEGVTDRTAAEQLVGARLFVHRDSLEQLADDEFYYHEIVGFSVVDQEGRIIGTVSGVMPTTIDILEVSTPYGEILIPAVEDTVVHMDKVQRTLTVANIEELL